MLLRNVAGLTNLRHAFADQVGGRVRSPMLIPSILQILDQAQAQTKIVEKAESGFQAELVEANRKLSALETVGTEMADAADPAKPQDPKPQNQTAPLERFGLSELLRTITKFEESKQSRVVDFFE